MVGMLKPEELLEVMKSRRSIREYMMKAVPEEHIRLILEAARWAPSGANTQPWEFIVVRDQVVKERIRSLLVEKYRKAKELYPSFPWDAMPWLPDCKYLSDVPVIIAVVGDPRKKRVYPGRNDEIFCFSIAAAIMNMLLMATALGLGTVWLTHSLVPEEDLKRALNIPPELRLMSLIPVGYPPKPIGSYYPSPWVRSGHERLDLDRMVHYDQYGNKAKVHSV